MSGEKITEPEELAKRWQDNSREWNRAAVLSLCDEMVALLRKQHEKNEQLKIENAELLETWHPPAALMTKDAAIEMLQAHARKQQERIEALDADRRHWELCCREAEQQWCNLKAQLSSSQQEGKDRS